MWSCTLAVSTVVSNTDSNATVAYLRRFDASAIGVNSLRHSQCEHCVAMHPTSSPAQYQYMLRIEVSFVLEVILRLLW